MTSLTKSLTSLTTHSRVNRKSSFLDITQEDLRIKTITNYYTTGYSENIIWEMSSIIQVWIMMLQIYKLTIWPAPWKYSNNDVYIRLESPQQWLEIPACQLSNRIFVKTVIIHFNSVVPIEVSSTEHPSCLLMKSVVAWKICCALFWNRKVTI